MKEESARGVIALFSIIYTIIGVVFLLVGLFRGLDMRQIIKSTEDLNITDGKFVVNLVLFIIFTFIALIFFAVGLGKSITAQFWTHRPIPVAIVLIVLNSILFAVSILQIVLIMIFAFI